MIEAYLRANKMFVDYNEVKTLHFSDASFLMSIFVYHRT